MSVALPDISLPSAQTRQLRKSNDCWHLGPSPLRVPEHNWTRQFLRPNDCSICFFNSSEFSPSVLYGLFLVLSSSKVVISEGRGEFCSRQALKWTSLLSFYIKFWLHDKVCMGLSPNYWKRVWWNHSNVNMGPSWVRGSPMLNFFSIIVILNSFFETGDSFVCQLLGVPPFAAGLHEVNRSTTLVETMPTTMSKPAMVKGKIWMEWIWIQNLPPPNIGP